MNKANNKKSILLVYPKYTETFWSFKYALKIIGKKAAYPPLGLLTIAGMMPKDWDKKLIDMNVEKLKDEDIKKVDYVFISAMIIQKESAVKAIVQIKKIGKPIVAGGPLFTTGWEEFSQIDHFVLGESEDTFPLLVNDIKKDTVKKTYINKEFPDIKKSPVPDWSLINTSKYNSLCIQYSRGCPFNCEFCDIVILNGRIPRFKTKEQIISELDAIYNQGWRGGVFFVDDNFIGNKARVKKDQLPAIIKWQKERNYPLSFNTQASINLADDPELANLMVEAGFTTVFVGIETPDSKGLSECGKHQNENRDLVLSVKKIQNAGLEVQGGFIVGFDSDKTSIFQRQIDFIQKSGIVTAMVGVLIALPKTRLYKRLSETNRITEETLADNTKFSSLNFVPKMDKETLLNGYKKILKTIYEPKNYYERIKTLIREFKPPKRGLQKLKLYHIKALLYSFWTLGIKNRGRYYYWKLILWSLFKHPRHFPYTIGFSIIGIHFRLLTA